MEAPRINAIAAPAPSVFARRGFVGVLTISTRHLEAEFFRVAGVPAARMDDLVLECTNMPPHARAIEAATGLKTWSLLQSDRLFAPWEGRVQEMCP